MTLSTTERDTLDRLLLELEDELEAERIAEARALLEEARGLAGPNHPEVVFAEGLIAWEDAGPKAAGVLFEKVIELEPEHADARHAMGFVHEAADNFAGMVEQFLEVRQLDSMRDMLAGRGTPEDMDFIERKAQEVLAALPEEFAKRLADVPVVLEPRPSEGLVEEGFDPRALGLFEGYEQAQSNELARAPTRIVLFGNNLLSAFPEDEELAEQVEITLLHEVGHFFGLDEEGVGRLGLA